MSVARQIRVEWRSRLPKSIFPVSFICLLHCTTLWLLSHLVIVKITVLPARTCNTTCHLPRFVIHKSCPAYNKTYTPLQKLVYSKFVSQNILRLKKWNNQQQAIASLKRLELARNNSKNVESLLWVTHDIDKYSVVLDSVNFQFKKTILW